ncbi:MAG: HAD family hydrolase [Desulfobulbaceae bacterium]|jgi:HAD superfamily hydrolase (TIGR01549 family)|nr:HAD family hydrolase [Desulfobulbaceae bacterium]
MLKALIFDCDGVMFDSRETNRAYHDHLLAAFGLPPMDEDELEYVHIHNVWESVAHIFRNYAVSLDKVHEFRLRDDYRPFFRSMKMEPDLRKFLARAKPRFKLAIATNRTNTMEAILEEFDLTDFFDKVMTAENSRRPKPAPEPLLEIIEAFACRIDEALYVGDSSIDEQCARACAMPFVAFRNPRLTARYHIQSFLDLFSLPPLAEAMRVA